MIALPAAFLFDCDGILADSEGLTNQIVAEDLTARGWDLTGEEARKAFIGMAIPAMVPLIEERIGTLPPDWAAKLAVRITNIMSREVPPVPGAGEALKRLKAAQKPFACASNSSHMELVAKLDRLDFAQFFEGRVLSFEDVDRPKPYPDLYLAAAAACGARPEDCVVIEDSVAGTRAGVAAGCRVMGLVGETPKGVLAAYGATEFSSMAELPGLFGI